MNKLIFALYTLLFCTHVFAGIVKNGPRSFTFTNSEGSEIKIELGSDVVGVIEYMAAVTHTNDHCQGCTMFLFRNMAGTYYLHYEDCVRAVKSDLSTLLDLTSSFGSGLIIPSSTGAHTGFVQWHAGASRPSANIRQGQMRTVIAQGLVRSSESTFSMPSQASNTNFNYGLYTIIEESEI